MEPSKKYQRTARFSIEMRGDSNMRDGLHEKNKRSENINSKNVPE